VLREPYRNTEEWPREVFNDLATGVAEVEAGELMHVLGEGREVFDEMQDLWHHAIDNIGIIMTHDISYMQYT
jgi:hypothetical protein